MTVRLADLDTPEQPVIRLGPELRKIVDETIAALRNDEWIFQRDGRLVDVVRVTETDAVNRDGDPVGTPRIRPMTAATLRERITGVACVERFDERKRKWVGALPNEPLVAAVLARGEYHGIRPIVGILEAPSLRPDFSIIQGEPGYDRTGYLYMPTVEFPTVPDRPSRDDAVAALAELEEAFCDFPFSRPEHKAATIAGVLTLLARPAVRNVPAFLNDANTRGSGKTLVTDTQSTIVTGRPTSKMSYPHDDIELEKVLGAYALRSAAIVNFDNVTRAFGGGPLDRCLTATDTVELRILGKTEIPSLSWRTVIFATGNNLTLTGDTSRRSIIARLESPLERPELRSAFKHFPLLPWVQTHRARLVTAALTVLRAWHVGGRPGMGCKPWGSFDEWAAVIPPAIVFAGGADPLLARPAELGQEEPEKAALIAILDGLEKLDPRKDGVTAKTIVSALYPPRHPGEPLPVDGYTDLREALEELTRCRSGKSPTPREVGKALGKFRSRVVGNRCLDSESIHGGLLRWTVRAVGSVGSVGTIPTTPREDHMDLSSNGFGSIPPIQPIHESDEGESFQGYLHGEGIQ